MASQALALLPLDADVDVDEPVPLQTNPMELLHAAETLPRTCSLEAYPAGAAQVIVAICNLIREYDV